MWPNPYSTCFTSPNKCQFENPSDCSPIEIAANLPSVGQIVGPHGSGKSTLAFAIGQLLLQQNRIANIRSLIFRRGQVCSRSDWQQSSSDEHGQLLIVDGIESLNWVHRRISLWYLQRNGNFNLLTTHCKLNGVPTVQKTAPQIDHFTKLAMKLQANREFRVSHAEIVSAYTRNQGNYRAALMELYDVWQDYQRVQPQSPAI